MAEDPHLAVQRPWVGALEIEETLDRLERELDSRKAKYGDGAYAGPHEALGIVTEEYLELVDAVRGNDDTTAAGELMDIAVACVFAIASLKTLRRIA